MWGVVAGIVLMVVGLVSVGTTTGWTSIPAWLFAMAIGLILLLQGWAALRNRRTTPAPEPAGVEPVTGARVTPIPVEAERSQERPPQSQGDAASSPDQELLRGLGLEVDDSNASTQPR